MIISGNKDKKKHCGALKDQFSLEKQNPTNFFN